MLAQLNDRLYSDDKFDVFKISGCFDCNKAEK